MLQTENKNDYSVTGDIERLHSLASVIEIGIIEVSHNDEITYCNPHAAELIGHTVGTNLPTLFTSLFANNTSTAAWHEIKTWLKDNQTKQDLKRNIDIQCADNLLVSCEITVPRKLNNHHRTSVFLIKRLDELSQTRHRLEKVNRQFKVASESANIGIWNHDFHLNYTEWDDQMLSLYGVTEEEYDGTPEFWEQQVHPDDLALVRQELLDCIYKDKQLNTQFRIHLPDGSERTLKAYGYCQSDAYGQPDAVVGVNYDITEQLLLAQHAEDESRLKQAILDGANFSIISTNTEGLIQTFNAGAQQFLAINEAQVIAQMTPLSFHLSTEISARKTKLTLDYPHKTFSDFDVLTHKASLGEADEREWHYVKPDGTLRPVMLSVTALRSSDGELDGFLFIGRSLDEVKWHERESKRTKKLLETTERMAMLGGWEYNILQQEFNGSSGLHNIFGVSGGQGMSLSNIIELFPRDAQKVIRQAVMRAIERGLPWDLKLPYRYQNKKDIWLRTHGYAEFHDGRAVRLKGAFQDISAMKQAEEKAKTASLAKSEFLANMSHELRTPINGIIGMTQLLMKSTLNESQAHFAKLTKMSADALLTLVNDILDFSKIEAGKLDIEKIDVNLPELLDVINDSFNFKAEEKSLALSLTIDDDVPHNVISDPTRIRQILNNLISNAFKFTQQGEIKIAVSHLDQQLLFSVEDTGIGIPKDKAMNLFDKFTQLDTSTTRRYGGTGLGLAISKQLSTLMGGEIGVNSVEGKGSLFWFTIALVPAGISTPQPQSTTESPPAEPALQDIPLTILLVEDNYINQQVCIEFLVSLGHQVILASDGQQALDRLNTGQAFDVILMDCQMPVLDGYETTRAIRQDTSGLFDINIPIIALTANAMEDDKQKCLRSGMNYYLAKPFNIDELSSSLTKLSREPDS